jgi:hypothetical protein
VRISLKAHVVGGIETRLACDVARAALKGAEACGIVVALLVRWVELAERLRQLGGDVLMFG